MKIKLAVLTALMGSMGGASAALISVNFVSVNVVDGGGTDSARSVLDPTTTAGIGGESNWNNSTTGLATAAGTLSTLVDSMGTVTGAELMWTSGGAFQDNTANADANLGVGDAQLKHGFLDDTGISTIDVTGIPYANYEVILYFATAGTTVGNYGSYTVNGVGTAATALGTKANYAGNMGWDASNTVTIPGLTGDLTILTPLRVDPARGSIAGFQIIQIPEPSSVAFLSLGGLALILLRRRK